MATFTPDHSSNPLHLTRLTLDLDAIPHPQPHNPQPHGSQSHSAAAISLLTSALPHRHRPAQQDLADIITVLHRDLESATC